MIITNDRSELEAVLADPCNTILLLFGLQPEAKQIHDKAIGSNLLEDWNKIFLIEDPSVLTAEEKADWYLDDRHYSLLSKPTDGNKRAVVEQELLVNLCSPSGAPSSRKIVISFGLADGFK